MLCLVFHRLLSRLADRAVVSFASSLQYFRGKGVLLGNPVRPEFYQLPRRQPGEILNLLIFGGSQGSRFLNDRIIDSLPYFRGLRDSLVICHQTGDKDFNRVKQAYSQAGLERVTVSPYFSPMSDYLAAADLVLCRAGATTCAELIAAASQPSWFLLPRRPTTTRSGMPGNSNRLVGLKSSWKRILNLTSWRPGLNFISIILRF
jgi:UDP-N-acetylglucosamine:LPS N-acetylglucosamine transferase